MEQKTAIALVLMVGCALLLFGCAQAGNGTSQNQPASGQGGQVGAPNGTPAGNGTQYMPATAGMLSLSDNETNAGASDLSGTAYTELPVDDGTDLPVNSS